MEVYFIDIDYQIGVWKEVLGGILLAINILSSHLLESYVNIRISTSLLYIISSNILSTYKPTSLNTLGKTFKKEKIYTCIYPFLDSLF